MNRLLLIEDDRDFARRMARNLELDGFEVETAADGAEGVAALARGRFDAALCDLRMPGRDGLDVLRHVRGGEDPEIDPAIPIVILTSVSSVDAAVEAMRLGATDYLTKESGRAEIALRVRRALEQRRIAAENEQLRERLAATDDFRDLIGASEELGRVKRDIGEVGPTNATVLILGETGVGKELVARAIHNASGRRGQFIDLNSALLPDDNLLQSELFGHERGAFTDARAMKRGKLELADAGTLFLDEIGELPRETQAKLLRVLETMTFTRLGGTRPIRADVRIVAATNRDLRAEAEAGRFREDLYYRLSVFPIEVKPLRERRADVLPLAEHFLALFAKRYGRPAPRLDSAAAAALERYRFPGNVRELRNICERLLIRARGGAVTEALLAECGIGPAPAAPKALALPPEGVQLDDLERRLVVEALDRAEWNQTEAARLLGISVDRMNNRVKKFALTHEKWRVHKGE
ncbi:MAG: sigma-54 dependent transcriptional regulator [Candidatus Sumerlaeia bacterium]|nr:sigma-54 dependent transcriptional regulator [Candidatus Sumerlaeia bacterium]